MIVPPACPWSDDVTLSSSPFDDVIAVPLAPLSLRSVSPLVCVAGVIVCATGLCVCAVRVLPEWVCGFPLALTSVAFCFVITVKPESFVFLAPSFTSVFQTDFSDNILFLLSLETTSVPLLWPSGLSLEKWSVFRGPITGLVTLRLTLVGLSSVLFFAGELKVLGFLALCDSWGGLMSLFMEPEHPSAPLVFPPFSTIPLRTLRPLDRGLRQMGDSWLSFSRLEEGDEACLIWLLGVSGTARRRSGDEGRKFSRSLRMLLFKGEWSLGVEVSPHLTSGLVFASAAPVTDNFVENES